MRQMTLVPVALVIYAAIVTHGTAHRTLSRITQRRLMALALILVLPSLALACHRGSPLEEAGQTATAVPSPTTVATPSPTPTIPPDVHLTIGYAGDVLAGSRDTTSAA